MPVSRVARRMADGWIDIVRRVHDGRSAIPAEGLTRSAFVDSFLCEMEPALVDEALSGLHRRKAVFVRQHRGHVRIFGRKPSGSVAKPERPSAALCRFVSIVAPYMRDLARAERARSVARTADDWLTHDARDDEIRAHAHRILGLCRAHTDRGLGLDEMRAALHDTFNPDALAALAFYEPRLQREANAEDLKPKGKAKAKRLPNGLTREAKVFALIEKAGAHGIVRKDLKAALTPKAKAGEIESITSALEAEGSIVGGTVRLQAAGRPGLRYFAASIGLPQVDGDGIAVIPDDD